MTWELKCLTEKIKYGVTDDEKALDECLSCGAVPPAIEYIET